MSTWAVEKPATPKPMGPLPYDPKHRAQYIPAHDVEWMRLNTSILIVLLAAWPWHQNDFAGC